MSRVEPRSSNDFSLGFFFGFLAGTFGTFLFTTETGGWLLAKIINLGEEGTKKILEGGKDLVDEADLGSFWSDEAESSGKKKDTSKTLEKKDRQTTEGKSPRRFFHHS